MTHLVLFVGAKFFDETFFRIEQISGRDGFSVGNDARRKGVRVRKVGDEVCRRVEKIPGQESVRVEENGPFGVKFRENV